MRKYKSDITKGICVLAILLASYVADAAIVYAGLADQVSLTCGLVWQGQLTADKEVYACSTFFAQCTKKTYDAEFCAAAWEKNKAEILKELKQ